MAFVSESVIKETTTTQGTSDFSLKGSTKAFRAFSAVMNDGDTCRYRAVDTSDGKWEIGTGTYDAGTDTLERTTVDLSSNSDNKVDFDGGTKQVGMVADADRLPVLDASPSADQVASYDGSKWTAGSVPDAALTSNVALLDTAQTYTSQSIVSGDSGSVTDGGTVDSPSWVFRGYYDSDATAGVNATKRQISIRTAVQYQGAGGDYRLALLDDGGSEFGSISPLNNDGQINKPNLIIGLNDGDLSPYGAFSKSAVIAAVSPADDTWFVAGNDSADGQAKNQGGIAWSWSTQDNPKMAKIAVRSDGPTANKRGAHMLFRVREDGSSSTEPATRMTLSDTGHLNIGDDSLPADFALKVQGKSQILGNLRVQGDVFPDSDASQSVGQNGMQFKEGYFSGTLGADQIALKDTTVAAAGNAIQAKVGDTNVDQLWVSSQSGAGGTLHRWRVRHANVGDVVTFTAERGDDDGDGRLDIEVAKNGTMSRAIRVIEGGNVGIQKAVPATALDVGGTVTATGLNINPTNTYSLSNVTTDRTLDADSTTTAELADVLATLIQDLGYDA